MEDNKIIHYDSPEAAIYKTGIEGWVGGGRFFGKDEHLARYNGCTHVKCDSCGAPAPKPYIKCEECRNKASIQRWAALPFKEWDGQDVLCTWDGDQYFFSEEELIDYLYDNELNGCDVMLVIAEGINYRQINYGYWGDEAHEDWEPPKELVEAVEKVNDLIRGLPPHSYTVGKIRTSYDYTYKPED